MLAGTIARLDDPVDEALESRFGSGGYPALEVRVTQTGFDDRPIQTGLAAARQTTTETEVAISGTGDDRSIDTERVKGRTTQVTEWVADPTGTGLVAAESVDGPGPLAFPFDQFYFATGQDIQRLRINVEALALAWDDADSLGNVWLNASDPGDGAAMQYHERADTRRTPTIGLGFERPWDGTVVEGVVYASGYVALYSVDSAIKFVRFCADEILPYAEPVDDEGDAQTTLEEGDVCDNCERETTTESYLGGQYCPTCIDAHDDPDAALDLSEVRP